MEPNKLKGDNDITDFWANWKYTSGLWPSIYENNWYGFDEFLLDFSSPILVIGDLIEYLLYVCHFSYEFCGDYYYDFTVWEKDCCY